MKNKIQTKFFKFILKNFKFDLFKLIILSILQSIFQVLSIFILIAFLISLLTDKNENNYIDEIFDLELSSLFSITNQNLTFIIITLSLIFISKNIILILISWIKLDICGQIYRKICSKVYDSILNKKMEFFNSYSAGDFIQNVQGESEFSKEVLLSYVIIFTEILIILSLFLILFASLNLKAFIIILSIILGCIFYSLILKRYNNILGEKRKINSINVFNLMLGTLSLLKLIKLKNKNNFFLYKLRQHITKLYKINRNQNVIQQSTHIWLESIMILVIMGLLLLLLNDVGFDNVNISELLFISLITLRFFPSFSTILGSVTNINYGKVSITNTLDIIEQQTRIKQFEGVDNNFYFKTMEIKSLYYKYPNTEKYVIKNFNASLKFPSLVGIKGSNGSGKTTLLNIISGLFVPSKGWIKIDNKLLRENSSLLSTWKMNLGYVDQKNFFTDESIKNVVAFGENDSDIVEEKIIKSLKLVGLENIFKNLHLKLGEGGKKLSGGQLQRLNIARALYFNSRVYIFDEITNNLDKQSFKKIISLIKILKKTHLIFITSHNDYVLKECDKILSLY